MEVERRRAVGDISSVTRAKLTLDDLKSHAPIAVTAPPYPADANGCSGLSIRHLLGKATSGVGVLQGDTETEKIDYAELGQGVVLYLDQNGDAINSEQGGPIRAVFPQGVAMQDDSDPPTPADVRDLRVLVLTT